MVEANQYLKTTNDKSKAVVEEEKDDASEIDDLLADVSAQDSISASGSNPILDRIVGQGFQGGPVLAQAKSKPFDSSSASTRKPIVYLITNRIIPAVITENAPTIPTPAN